MHALFPVLAVLGLASAQETYTVWSTVLFLRTGDRSPLTSANVPTTLTPLGAQQMHSVGNFFRERYITSSTGNASYDAAPLQGLSASVPQDAQMYLLALDTQYTAASAQAFMQGLYPPYSLNSTAASESTGTDLNELGFLGNGSYIESPLDGYQYTHVHVASEFDYNSIYVGGSLNCPSLTYSLDPWYNSPAFQSNLNDSELLYQTIGDDYLQGNVDSGFWTFTNAYPMFDNVNFLATHNISVNSELKASQAIEDNKIINATYLDQLRWLADIQQTAYLGNTSTPNPSGAAFETATLGSISTIAGATLAAKILDQFNTSIDYSGDVYKLSLLVGDFDAFTSFFALASLPNLNANFYGLPDFASVMAFELFSTTAGADGFPAQEDLWVRFLFRNGTDDSTSTATQTGADDGYSDNIAGGLQAYPLFGRGPSETDMAWSDFVALMQSIAIAGPGDWCNMCGADTMPSLWCAAWNSSLAFVQTDGSSSDTATKTNKRDGFSAAVVGTIGAVIALAIVGVLVCALLLLGFRVQKVERGRKAGLGGFKGATKLGSDTDLSVPSKSGAVVGATVERKGSFGKDDEDTGVAVPGGRERVGSWEMKDTGRSAFGRSTESLDVGASPVRVEEQV